MIVLLKFTYVHVFNVKILVFYSQGITIYMHVYIYDQDIFFTELTEKSLNS